MPSIRARQCSSLRVISVSSMPTSATWRATPSRRCSMATMFARSSATVREELDQLARPVGQTAADHEDPSGERQPVAHHRDQQRRIDVPARQQRAHRALAVDLAGQQRRDADRAGALDHQLRAFEQQRDRLADLLVADLDQLVEQVVEDRHRHLARVLDRDAVGDRVRAALGMHADRGAPPAAARASRSRCRRRGRRRPPG